MDKFTILYVRDGKQEAIEIIAPDSEAARAYFWEHAPAFFWWQNELKILRIM